MVPSRDKKRESRTHQNNCQNEDVGETLQIEIVKSMSEETRKPGR